jgi:hypothetical protein
MSYNNEGLEELIDSTQLTSIVEEVNIEMTKYIKSKKG